MLQSYLPMLLEIVELAGDAKEVRQNFAGQVHDATDRHHTYCTFLGAAAPRGLEMHAPVLSPSRRTAAIFSAASGSMVAMRPCKEAESPRLAALCRLLRESLDVFSRCMCTAVATSTSSLFTLQVARHGHSQQQ